MSQGIAAELKKIPPVTRFIAGSSLAITGASALGIVSPYNLVFVVGEVLERFEVWRAYTSFFLGPPRLEYIFEFFMLFRTSEGIESQYFQGRSADYAWQAFFAALGILASNVPLRSMLHNRAFLHSLVYLQSALAPPGAQASVMGLVTIPVAYYPYALLAMDFLMGGGAVAAQSISGMLVGHLWWWLVWGAGTGAGAAETGAYAGWGRAPRWLRDWFGERGGPRTGGGGGDRAYRAYAPRDRQPGAEQEGRYRWGSGQRLGSD